MGVPLGDVGVVHRSVTDEDDPWVGLSVRYSFNEILFDPFVLVGPGGVGMFGGHEGKVYVSVFNRIPEVSISSTLRARHSIPGVKRSVVIILRCKN